MLSINLNLNLNYSRMPFEGALLQKSVAFHLS
jgi:hypothetical protein